MPGSRWQEKGSSVPRCSRSAIDKTAVLGDRQVVVLTGGAACCAYGASLRACGGVRLDRGAVLGGGMQNNSNMIAMADVPCGLLKKPRSSGLGEPSMNKDTPSAGPLVRFIARALHHGHRGAKVELPALAMGDLVRLGLKLR